MHHGTPPPVLIAGLGYLGSALARALRSAGHPVVGLVRPSADPTGLGPRPYPVESGDLSDSESLQRVADSLAEQAVDLGRIVHCASSGRGGPDAYRAVFAGGARNLAAAFPGVPIFLTSSTSVYGQTDGSTVTESSHADPDRETGRILREAEDFVLAGGGTVLRLAGLYGPQRSVHLRKFFDGTATIESGEASRFLNQIHRDDAVSALQHLLDLPAAAVAGQVFNVADDEPLTQRALYEALAERYGRPIPPEAPPDRDRKRAWTHKRVSNAKLRSTGWAPRFGGFLAALDLDPDLVRTNRGDGDRD